MLAARLGETVDWAAWQLDLLRVELERGAVVRQFDALQMQEARDLTLGHQAKRETWELWREDDNGNRFLVARGSREDLEQQRLQFEARGHKQRYWRAPGRLPADSN